MSVRPLLLAAACLFPLTAAADNHEGTAHGDVPTEAVAKVIPTVGNTVNGIIVLTQKGEDVHVTGEVWNLTPGEHGFHIHQFGDMRSSDGKSAGGHYNPDGHDHGGPDAEKRHAGDLGNITAGPNGRAKVDKTAKGLKLHFVIGRSIVVHAGRDDLQSQPSGDAGARVGLGVIGFAEVKMDDAKQVQKPSEQPKPPAEVKPQPNKQPTTDEKPKADDKKPADVDKGDANENEADK